MSNFTAADVKKLRDLTGSGMMDCKKALEESEGDFDKAVEILRIKGAKDVGKRAGRTAANGLVAAAGIDLARFVYCRAVGLPLPKVDGFRSGVRVIDPALDLLSFLERRRAGQVDTDVDADLRPGRRHHSRRENRCEHQSLHGHLQSLESSHERRRVHHRCGGGLPRSTDQPVY